MTQLRVIRDERADGRGLYAYRVEGSTVEGRSREPLLDACRRLKSLGVDMRTPISMFREGREVWDLRTTVGYGADRTVGEEQKTTTFKRVREYGGPQ